MAEFSSFAAFAGFLTSAVAASEHNKRAALEAAAQVVETAAKEAIGTYTFGWPELAQATQEERARLGYTPNDPLKRTGALQESITHTVGHDEALIGSNLDIAVYQELGTSRIPPRPFLQSAAIQKGPEVVKIIGQRYAAKLLTRG